jgi:hypothetical protein
MRLDRLDPNLSPPFREHPDYDRDEEERVDYPTTFVDLDLFLRWLREEGRLDLADAIEIVSSPHSWSEEWREYRAAVEAENAERAA